MEPHFTVEMTATLDTDLPAEVASGSSTSVVTTATVTVPESIVSYAYTTYGARSVAGLAQIETDVDGPGLAGVTANIESTPLPASGPVSIQLRSLRQTFKTAAAGTEVITGYVYMTALQFPRSSGSTVQMIVVCSPKATTPAQDLTIDTVSVAMPVQATTTTVTAAYAHRTHRLKAKIRVARADGTPAAGRARLTLNRAGHRVRTTTVTLDATGAARAAFAGVRRPGRYVVKARYAGSAASKASVGKASLAIP